ncbi:MAG: lytic transglycosylase domain-containing protein [Alphaproteobacteria bacterium]|nr:lytic transglycosylase domain-containing protein [Alphaproteobacteria bacterium]
MTMFSLSTRLAGAAIFLFAWTSTPATGQMAPIADDDGARHVRSHAQTLSASDLSMLERAFDYCDRKQWDAARQVAAQISNPAARDVVLWRAFTNKDNGAAFSDLDRFLAGHREWPNQRGLQARTEEAMPADSMQPDQIIAWFQGRDPVSGEGMVKLGDAYLRKSQEASAKNWIRKGWIDGNFSLERMAYISARYGSHLTSDDHKRRASRLVWAGEYGQANAMTNWIGADVSALMNARIKLRQAARDADAAYNRVPSSLSGDPGLLFDRARWLRKRDRDVEARPLLIAASINLNEPPPVVEEWWTERNYQTREALDAGNVQQAYQLAAGHDLRKDAGVPYAEAEFLAGWISLRYLNKPDPAYDHFLRLRDGVTAPISVARAHYWAGRAAEKAGRTAESQNQYKLAANFPMTYYGQLAASVVNPRGNLDLPLARSTSSSKQAFMDQSMMQAMQALADVGAEGLLRTFALAAAEGFTDRDQFVMLTTFLRGLNQPAMALRVAKRGLQKNVAVYDIAYPTMSVPAYRGNGTPPETALVLGLTRQESEFDHEAMSSVGARGLMQLMPATAKLTARRHGINYGDKNDLLTPSVNMQLGMAHVSDLLSDLGGSYVLSIASYNAGQGRINQWVSTYGDPRATNADMIDWIERIPFSETRNYVQRVIENTQIYRNVLAGRDVPLVIHSDLKRGAYTAVASASAQFSSSPAPAATPAVSPVQTPATTPVATGAQFASVVSSKPVYDDEEEAAPVKKKTKKATSKKKKKKKRKATTS